MQTLDNLPVAGADLKYGSAIYGKAIIEKIDTAGPSKKALIAAIDFMHEKLAKFYVLKKGAATVDVSEWEPVEAVVFNAFFDVWKKDSHGRKAMIHVLNFLVKQAEVEYDPNQEKLLLLVVVLGRIIAKGGSVTDEEVTISVDTPRSSNDVSFVPNVANDESTKSGGREYTDSHSSRSVIINGLPRFGGEKFESLEQWIFQLDDSLKLNRVTDEKALSVVAPLLKGTALHIYRKMRKEFEDSFRDLKWSDIRTKFRTIFKDTDEQRKLRRDLIQLTSGRNDNFHDYLKRFTSINSCLENMTDGDVMFYFIEGLSNQVKASVLSQDPMSLAHAIQYASYHYDAKCSNSERRIESVNYSRSSNKRFDGNRNNHRSQNNIGFKPLAPNSGQRFVKKQYGTSFKKPFTQTYGKPGSRPLFKPRPPPSGKPPGSETRKCYNCGKIGHIAPNCRSSRNVKKAYTAEFLDNGVEPEIINTLELVNSVSSKAGKLMKIVGKVNDVDVSFIIDTGATSSIIPKAVALECGIKTSPTQVQIRLANGEVINAYGMTETVAVEFDNKKTYIEFVVIEKNANTALLGQDWLLKSNAVLWPSKNKLIFPNKAGCDDSELQLELAKERETEEAYVLDHFTSHEDDDFYSQETWDFARERKEVTLENKFSPEVERMLDVAIRRPVLERSAFSLADLNEKVKFSCKIRTEPHSPIYVPQARLSLATQELVDKEVALLLKHDIIEVSKSPYSSQVKMVIQKGNPRMVHNFIPINRVTITERFPIPRVQDILDKCAGAKWFTTLDLMKGYLQIPLDEDSRELTAFSTHSSHYHYKKMCFGLKNAPFQFSSIMFSLFSSMSDYVTVFIDDICVYSKSFSDHVKQVAEVMRVLKEAGLKIKLSKCKFFAQRVRLLGHIVSGDKVETCPDIVAPLINRERPKTLKDVQIFLGLCNFYRKFIAGFAEISRPIQDLLKGIAPRDKKDKYKISEYTASETISLKGQKLVWTYECETAFKELIKKLTSAPILRQPDMSRPFTIQCDASIHALGSILSQVDDNGNEYVVCYASRTLKGAEKNMAATALECLALWWSCKVFYPYIEHNEFDVISDCSSITSIMKAKDLSGRLGRMALDLQGLKIRNVFHRAGKLSANCDALSRPPLTSVEQIEVNHVLSECAAEFEQSTKRIDPFEDKALMYFLTQGKHLDGLSNKQMKRINICAPLLKLRNLENGDRALEINKNGLQLIYPSPDMRANIIKRYHSLGHMTNVT